MAVSAPSACSRGPARPQRRLRRKSLSRSTQRDHHRVFRGGNPYIYIYIVCICIGICINYIYIHIYVFDCIWSIFKSLMMNLKPDWWWLMMFLMFAGISSREIEKSSFMGQGMLGRLLPNIKRIQLRGCRNYGHLWVQSNCVLLGHTSSYIII